VSGDQDDPAGDALSGEPRGEPAVAGPVRLPLLLGAEAAAAYVGVSRSEFYRLDLTGRVPQAVRFGKLKRWSRLELLRWVEAGCPPRDRWEKQTS